MFIATINDTEFKIDFDNQEGNTGKINGKDFALDLVRTGPDSFNVIKGNASHCVELVEVDYETKTIELKVGDEKYHVQVKDEMDTLLKKMGMSDLYGSKINEIRAPMPGLVLDIAVEPGSHIAKGDKLLVLEAMKMENNIKSPTEGVVKSINCKKGDAVEKNAVLIVFE